MVCLETILEIFIVFYLYDILIYSETWEDHLKHVRTALKVLQRNKLYGKNPNVVLKLKNLSRLGSFCGLTGFS